jgi:hypothetical protein
MVLDESLLVKKEDLSKEYTCDRLYLKRLDPLIEKFRSLIKDSSNGEVEFKIKDIKNMMGDEFKDRDVTSFYSMLKTILIESGIKVRLHHWYGANVILSFAKDGEVRPYIELVRERQLKTAKNAGYESYRDYIRNTQAQRRNRMRSNITMHDKDSKHYFVDIGRKYIVPVLFPGAIINEFALTNQYSEEKGGYDWISNGLKWKHQASTLRHKVDEDCERLIFQWGIKNNNRADVFILTAWDNIENLGLIKAWIFDAHEIVNNKEFWNRESFLISTNKRSMDKYSKYEVDDERLDLIRNKILYDQEITIIDDEKINEV